MGKYTDQVNNLFDQASLQNQNLEMSEVSNYGFNQRAEYLDQPSEIQNAAIRDGSQIGANSDLIQSEFDENSVVSKNNQ